MSQIETNRERAQFSSTREGNSREENPSYKKGLDVFLDLRSGKPVSWLYIINNQPAVLQGFMHMFADRLPGSPPASMVLEVELERPQDFLNGHSAQRLYNVSAEEVRKKEERDTNPMFYLLERAEIPTTSSDIIVASSLGRRIPWERNYPGETLSGFLQELKRREEAVTSQTMLPLPLWDYREFYRRYATLQNKSLKGLLHHLEKEGKKRNMKPLPFLHEKAALRPTVDDVIETVLLGERIPQETFTPLIVEGLLTRAIAEDKSSLADLKMEKLRTTQYRFLEGRTLNFLVSHSKRHKPPGMPVMEFLVKPAEEIRERRLQFIAEAKRIRDLNRVNGGVLRYTALRDAGLLTDQLTEVFSGGEEEFLHILDIKKPQIVFPSPYIQPETTSTLSHPASLPTDPHGEERKILSQRALQLISQGRWYEAGNCRGEDTNKFVAFDLTDTQIEAATEVCTDCPVKGHCEVAGHLSKSYGIWGGTTDKQRQNKKKALKQSGGKERFAKYLADLPKLDIQRLQYISRKSV